MTECVPVHRDRQRAEAFGSAADRYDAYRPHYPEALISELVAREGVRTLDVGRIENGELEPLFDEAGLTSERRWYVEHLHYRTADWVNMVTTYSNVLTLDPIDQADLRAGSIRASGTPGSTRSTTPSRSRARPRSPTERPR